jgi:hypothetical protein
MFAVQGDFAIPIKGIDDEGGFATTQGKSPGLDTFHRACGEGWNVVDDPPDILPELFDQVLATNEMEVNLYTFDFIGSIGEMTVPVEYPSPEVAVLPEADHPGNEGFPRDDAVGFQALDDSGRMYIDRNSSIDTFVVFILGAETRG